MKQIIAILLAMFLILSLCACGKDDGSTPTNPSSNATTTAPAGSSPTGSSPTESAPTEPPQCSHVYEASITKEPTCSAIGETTYTCSNCSHSYTEQIDMLAHDYVEATCTAAKTCKVCGATDGQPLDHAYANGTCNLCGQSDPTFKSIHECRWVAIGIYGEDMIREHVLSFGEDGFMLSPILWSLEAWDGATSQVIDGKTYYMMANLGEPVYAEEKDGIISVYFWEDSDVFMRLERTAGDRLTVIEVENEMTLTSGIEIGTVFHWDHYVINGENHCQYCGATVS